MRKTQVVSVLALMLVLGIYTSGSTYAKDSLVTAAEAAQAAPESSISAKYPGLDKYLDKMISQYEDNSSAGAAEALSEATEAVNLLKGVNVKTQSETTQSNTVSNASRNTFVTYSSSSAAQVATVVETKQPEITKQPEQVATNIAVKVEEKPVVQAQEVVAESKVEEKTEGSKESTKVEEQPEMTDDVELPNTGVEKKIGAGEMILVSAAVVIATVGATLMVLRSRKK